MATTHCALLVMRSLFLYMLLFRFTDAYLPPSPHCNQSYSQTIISYLLQNLQDASVRYLGDATSTDDCRAKCKSLNYLCGASATNRNDYIFNDHNESTFTFNNPLCQLDIYEPLHDDWGSIMLLTPDFVAPSNEYIIDLEFALLTANQFNHSEAGIVFKSVWGQQPNHYVGISPDDYVVVGVYQNDQWMTYEAAAASISTNTRYTLRVHRQPSDLWIVYLDGELKWASSVSQTVLLSHPYDHVGVWSWGAYLRAYSLKVTFPSSIDEALCAAYMYNTATSRCDGYFGSNYSALYSSLTANSLYDSGIIEYAACPTVAPTATSLSTSTSGSIFELVAILISFVAWTLICCLCFVTYKRFKKKQKEENVAADQVKQPGLKPAESASQSEEEMKEAILMQVDLNHEYPEIAPVRHEFTMHPEPEGHVQIGVKHPVRYIGMVEMDKAIGEAGTGNRNNAISGAQSVEAETFLMVADGHEPDGWTATMNPSQPSDPQSMHVAVSNDRAAMHAQHSEDGDSSDDDLFAKPPSQISQATAFE